MDVHHSCNLFNFMPLLPVMRAHMPEWRLVHILLTPGSPYNVAYIARKLRAFFGADCEGALYLSGNNEVILLCRAASQTPESLSAQLVETLPRNNGDMRVVAVTADELLKIQIDLQEREAAQVPPYVSPLLSVRQDRLEDVVLIVDDDMLMRGLITKCFGGFSQILELDDYANAVETYLLELPDIVFLDIHMPGGSGLDALAEILLFDPTAHVVMLSADRVETTIRDAKKFGAKGYVAKPFTPEKLISCYNKTPTVQKQAL